VIIACHILDIYDLKISYLFMHRGFEGGSVQGLAPSHSRRDVKIHSKRPEWQRRYYEHPVLLCKEVSITS
jgi:hypothetical protein